MSQSRRCFSRVRPEKRSRASPPTSTCRSPSRWQGSDPDKTFIEVWADPTVEHNTHRIQVDSDSAKLDFTIQNIPSENPATGRLTPLSVVALLRKLASPLQIGT